MLAGITFLRLFGALCVLLFHTCEGFGQALDPVLPFLSIYGGYIGNAIFFITSGYLLEGRTDVYSEPLHRFLCRRVMKIYPMYILSNLVVKLVFLPGQAMSLSAWIQLLSLTGAGWFGSDSTLPNQHTWFVCVWLLCLLVSWLCHHSRHSKEAGAAIFLVGLLLVYTRPSFPILNYVVGEAILYFFCGILLLGITRMKDTRTIAALGMLLLGVALGGNSLLVGTVFRPELFAALLASGLLLLMLVLEPRISKTLTSMLRVINTWIKYIYFLQGPLLYFVLWIMSNTITTDMRPTSASGVYIAVTLLSTLAAALLAWCLGTLVTKRKASNSLELQ